MVDEEEHRSIEIQRNKYALIDDSPYKAIRNPENTAIHPRGYTVKERDTDDMLSERGALRQYLDRLASASIPNSWLPIHGTTEKSTRNTWRRLTSLRKRRNPRRRKRKRCSWRFATLLRSIWTYFNFFLAYLA